MNLRFLNNKHLLLAGASLLLLGIFLGYYLLMTYRAEEERLNKEIRYLFANAFKTTESKVFDKMIFDIKGVSWLNKDKDVNVTFSNHHSTILTIDSLKVRDRNAQIKNTIVIAKHKNNKINPSSMTLKVAIQADSVNGDSLHKMIPTGLRSNFSEIEKIFKENLQKSGLDVKYSITKDTATVDKKNTGAYEDVFTNEFYQINTQNNSHIILGAILPEIGLSVLMYLMVVFAFSTILRSARKQKQLYDMKQDFVRNMTHELKTPIATMGVALEAIQNFHAGQDENIKKEYFRIAESENKKLNAIVDKVISLSRLMDTNPQQQETVNIPQLIKVVVDSFHLRAEQTGCKIDFECEDTDIVVNTQPQNLNIILYNLIDNAIKYTKSPSPHVVVYAKLSDSSLTMSVRDNGTPIGEEFKSVIFEKFYRIPQGDVHDAKGHGLGLYIVSQLVKTMNGTIRCLATEEGNNFELKIPVEKMP